MKWVFWILLLGNAMLLAYFSMPEEPVTVMNQGSHQPLQAEKIKLLKPEDFAKLPAKTAQPEADQSTTLTPTPQIQTACYEWGIFSAAGLARAKNILTKFSLQASVKQQNSQEAVRYWVYIPSRGTMELAQQKMNELKALGVEESFILQEPQWKYAISLGIFKDEQLASKLLEELKAKGVVSAVKGVRNQEKGQSSLLISNMSVDTVSEIEKLKPDFPGSELKQVACQ